MKKLLLLLILSFFSIQSFAGSCPDGSEPVRSISDDGTYFVYNCGGSASTSSNTFEIQNPDRYCSSVILPNDVASIKKSNVCLNDKTAFKEYGLQVVDKKDGHPVRAGNKSMRFELRDGDCNNPPPPNWNDCKGDRERFEISGADMFDGEQGWHAWSIFLPSDFVDIMNPALLDLAQFSIETTKDSDPCCALLFKKTKNGFVLDSELQNRAWVPLGSPQEQTWSDFLVNYKWSKKDDGFIKLWLNNKLVYEYTGQTITKNTEYVYLKFGIYRGGLSRYLNHKNFTPEVETCFRNNGASNELINVTKKGEWSELLGLGADAPSFNIYKQCKHLYKIKMPTHVVYFDEVRAGKTKEEVTGKLPLGINSSKESESKIKVASDLVVAKEKEKLIPANLELPIFDDVKYKLEEQILKIHTGDPKMKPLQRHIGTLLMKCGSGLITGEKKDWLSFVRSDSDNVRNSKNQQCHYDYFKDSNDEEAWKLFQAVLGGTDSILNYLEENVER